MEEPRQKVSITTITFNEEGNIREFYNRSKAVLAEFPQYDYEIVVADNCSRDGTRAILTEIAAADKKFKCIFNARNFGPERSGLNVSLQATGDAVVKMSSDLQEPPELIRELLAGWHGGYDVVCAVKRDSREGRLMAGVRALYYRLLSSVSSDELVPQFNGTGLYSRKFMDALRRYDEPVPYFRGLVGEIGFKRKIVSYVQQPRQRGRSSYNLLSYYDHAMTGFVNHTKLPLRMAVFFGFVLACFSLLVAFGYFIYKLLYWDTFTLGLAPLVIGLFFFSAVQLIFIGVIGEYVGAIWTQVKNRPVVIEERRINFD